MELVSGDAPKYFRFLSSWAPNLPICVATNIRRGNFGVPWLGSRPANRQLLGPPSEDDIRVFQALRQQVCVWTENGDRYHWVPVHPETGKLFDEARSIQYHRWQRQQE